MTVVSGHVPVVPERSLEQRHEALARANAVRLGRVQVKREIGARRLSAAEVLLRPPECVRSMQVVDLLLAQPRWGRVRSLKALRVARVSESRPVGGLTERERSLLAGMLR